MAARQGAGRCFRLATEVFFQANSAYFLQKAPIYGKFERRASLFRLSSWFAAVIRTMLMHEFTHKLSTSLTGVLGCTRNELKRVQRAAHIRTEAQFVESVINYQDVDHEIRRVQKECKGKVVEFRIETKQGSAVRTDYFRDDWRGDLEAYAPGAERVIAVCRIANKHIPMTAAEIEAQQQAQQQAEVQARQTLAEAGSDEAETVSGTIPKRAKRTGDPILSDDSPLFVRQQLLRAIERLPYRVDRDRGVISDGAGGFITSLDCDLRTLLELVIAVRLEDIPQPVKVRDVPVAPDAADDVYAHWKQQSENMPF